MFLIIVVLSIAMFYLMRDRGEQKIRRQERARVRALKQEASV
jgi:multiple sugar transport system permease protein